MSRASSSSLRPSGGSSFARGMSNAHAQDMYEEVKGPRGVGLDLANHSSATYRSQNQTMSILAELHESTQSQPSRLLCISCANLSPNKTNSFEQASAVLAVYCKSPCRRHRDPWREEVVSKKRRPGTSTSRSFTGRLQDLHFRVSANFGDSNQGLQGS